MGKKGRVLTCSIECPHMARATPLPVTRAFRKHDVLFLRGFKAVKNPSDPAIWVVDLNVAPEPIDVYQPEKRVNDVDFHIDARTVYKETVSWGFVDVFRRLHPDVVQYTYWDYFRNALERNFGWRIDHILATETLAEKCQRAEVDMAPRKIKGASDHTIVWAEFS